MKGLVFLTVMIGLVSCEKTSKTAIQFNVESEVSIKYSSKIEINKLADNAGWLLNIKKPFQNASDQQYLISSETWDEERLPQSTIFIKLPIKSIIPVSTTYLSMIEALDEHEKIVGFSNTDYICSEAISSRVEKGLISNIGIETDFNIEKIVELSPDLIMGYAVNSSKSYKSIEKYGLSVMLNADYLESHPLGRAEWIKVFGILFEKYELADSIFSEIEKNYNSLSNLSEESKPTVISGSLYGDSWFTPGGNNYASKLLSDAGFSYVYENDTSSSFLKLSFESVYESSNEAEFWVSPAPFQTLDDLYKADERYGKFASFKQKNVWCYDKDLGPNGGNNYLEMGYLRPDIILKDLISIRTPGIFENYSTVFYRKLN